MMMLNPKIVFRGESAFVDNFKLFDVVLNNGITLRVAIGGDGDKTPVLMVHGHPHTHVIWRKVAPALAKDRKVILVDLRGYGDSSKPESMPDHRPYSKREMACDLQLMLQTLGIEQCDFWDMTAAGAWGIVLRWIGPSGCAGLFLSTSRRPLRCTSALTKNLRRVISGGFF